ncbi:MAG TPA: YdcF family protein [bacterium]|jgi:uncharacterized SAM-binding protein YcdF (DUF218 family)|nr:YdcF family protein [bacterium]
MAQGFFKKITVAFFAGILVMLLLAGGTLLWQKSYFDSCQRLQPSDTDPAQAVVVFAGGPERLDKGVEIANRHKADYFIISNGNLDDVKFEILKAGGLSKAHLWVNQQASTTDGDARYAAALLKRFKIQRAILVTSWFHLPRSIFLLKLYTAFSGITIIPLSVDQAPDDPWDQRMYQLEFVKLWGSLGRVALHAVHAFQNHLPAPRNGV